MTASLPPLEPWQFRVRPLSMTETVSTSDLVMGGWLLQTGPDLPCYEMRDESGQTCGCVLGFPLDLRSTAPPMLGVGLIAPEELDPRDPDRFAITLREVLGGRFLLLVIVENRVLVYTDIGGQVSAVYDYETRLFGSTAHALLPEAEYQARFDRGLYESLGVDGEGWLPAGMTAHRGVMRLLANHRLDLASGEATRFWPRDPIVSAAEPEEAAAEFIEILKKQLRILTQGSRRVALAMTAGRETRSILAISRHSLNHVDLVTIVGRDRHTVDSIVARGIATRFGINHRELPRVMASPEQQERFKRRTGHCNGDSNALYHPSVWPIAESHVFFGGVGGEVARSFFWRAVDTADTVLTPQMLVRRFGLPESGVHGGRMAQSLERWLAAAPKGDSLIVLDLAYLEHRVGPWGGAQFCGDPTLVRYAPMLTQAGVRLMLSLPPEWKRANMLGNRIVAREWAELGEIPYNSLGLWRDLMFKLRRALMDPSIVLKKIRKMRA